MLVGTSLEICNSGSTNKYYFYIIINYIEILASSETSVKANYPIKNEDVTTILRKYKAYCTQVVQKSEIGGRKNVHY